MSKVASARLKGHVSESRETPAAEAPPRGRDAPAFPPGPPGPLPPENRTIGRGVAVAGRSTGVAGRAYPSRRAIRDDTHDAHDAHDFQLSISIQP
jgi:hypothetical protein